MSEDSDISLLIVLLMFHFSVVPVYAGTFIWSFQRKSKFLSMLGLSSVPSRENPNVKLVAIISYMVLYQRPDVSS